MRALYFQPFSGASGDMILGALLDLGLALEDLDSDLRLLGLAGWRLESKKVARGALQATRLVIHVESGAGEHDHPPHLPEHSHDHDRPAHHPNHHARRSLQDILQIIGSSRLPAAVQATAAAVFQRLGEAEARVHGIPLEAVHFHEVGALDSILDIVGCSAAVHRLRIDEVWSGPVTVGTGYVGVAHGRLPLPAPATLELLRGVPVEQRDSGAELTTPTGAALLSTLAKGFGTLPPIVVSAVGYGAGDDRGGPVPNVLRAILGERAPGAPPTDRVVVLETAIDDMSPQWFGHLMERLLSEGALDVSVTPLLMKKSRPGHEVRVMVSPDAESRVLHTLFRESTTLGVRRGEVDRYALRREIVPVETPWGNVSVKVGYVGNDVVTAAPEYEELRAAAERALLPLKEVHEIVMQRFRRRE